VNNRIDARFAACRAANRKALVVYVTAGDPNLQVTEQLIPALAAAGADIIEVGVPFSDPMADGPVIQAASQRALKAGTNLAGILAMGERLRPQLDVPLVLFSYYNVLLQYGVEKLAEQSAQAGIDGWLVVDVPDEEAAEIEPSLRSRNLHRIVLLAPTTPPARAQHLLRDAGGFVYYITVTGVTGVRDRVADDLAANLSQAKQLTALPVCAGFGVSTPDMAKAVAAHADGVVVGSALVKLIADEPDPRLAVAKAADFVRSLAAALR